MASKESARLSARQRLIFVKVIGQVQLSIFFAWEDFHEEDFKVGVHFHDGDRDGDFFADAVRVGGHFGPELMEFMTLKDGLDSVGFLELKVLGVD
jgi:hypothetical protein